MLNSIEWTLMESFRQEVLNNPTLPEEVKIYMQKRVMELQKKSKEK